MLFFLVLVDLDQNVCVSVFPALRKICVWSRGKMT